jgi:hypothetical protein
MRATGQQTHHQVIARQSGENQHVLAVVFAGIPVHVEIAMVVNLSGLHGEFV